NRAQSTIGITAIGSSDLIYQLRNLICTTVVLSTSQLCFVPISSVVSSEVAMCGRGILSKLLPAPGELRLISRAIGGSASGYLWLWVNEFPLSLDLLANQPCRMPALSRG
ncbi:hypothetical protein HN011_007508, partial [Eciton burchellii]